MSFKMNLWQIGCEGQRQVELVLDRVLAVLNFEFYSQSVR